MPEVKNFNIGILTFNEQLGKDLIIKINETDPIEDLEGSLWKLVSEPFLLHEITTDYKSRYKLILDRRSHVLRQASSIMKIFAYSGVHIINNPFSFYYFMSNKDFAFSMMSKLGVNIPETYILPPYITPLLSPEEYKYQLKINWEKISDHIGFPCYIKPAAGRGAINVNKAENLEDLLYYYSQSGEEIMTVQKAVSSPFEWQLRCLCVGQSIKPIKYIFRPGDLSKYIFEENFLNSETGEIIINNSKIINRAFGYEMNTIEFIIDHNGTPWAIDFNNPVPDARPKALGKIFYEDFLKALYEHIKYIARYKPPYPFLPDLNTYAEIARLEISKEEKFQKALQNAEKYYSKIE